MALTTLKSLTATRFDLTRSGLAPTTGATTPMMLGPTRARVHVVPHQAHYRVPSGGAAAASRAERRRRRQRSQPVNVGVKPMIDSSAAELLTRLNHAYIRRPILTAILGVLLAIALAEGAFLGAGLAATIVFGVASAIVLWFVHETENRQSAEPVEYVLDRDTALAYRRLLKAFRRLVASGSIWRIDVRRGSDGRQFRRRRLVRPRLALPPRIVSNIRVPKLRCGRQTLYFFPDRILVYDAQLVWGVFYHELQVKAGDVRGVADQVIEEAEANLNGFLVIGSDSGLSEVFRCADPAGAAEVAAALQGMA